MLTHGVLSDSMQTYEYMVPVSEEPGGAAEIKVVAGEMCHSGLFICA